MVTNNDHIHMQRPGDTHEAPCGAVLETPEDRAKHETECVHCRAWLCITRRV